MRPPNTVAADVVEAQVSIANDADVMLARQKGRELGALLGLTGSDLTLIATAISEVARNIVLYAGSGLIELRGVEQGGRRGLMIVARDRGPGIPDIALAMQDGYSTSRGMGMGLPGSKRLMDNFEIVSEIGQGTTVTMVKWER